MERYGLSFQLMKFSLFTIIPIITLIYFWDEILRNLFLMICCIIVIFSIVILILYILKPPNLNKEKSEFMIFTQLLRTIEMDSFSEELPKARPMPRGAAITRHEPKYIRERFWNYYINIEAPLLTYLIYIPSILIILFSSKIYIISLILLATNIGLLGIWIIWTLYRINIVLKVRRKIERQILERLKQIENEVDTKEILDYLERILNYLKNPMYLYPVFYKFYIIISSGIGAFTYLIEFL